jgi:hypothetical protein
MGMEHHHEARARSGGAPEQQTQQRTERFWLADLLLLGRPGQCFPRVHLWLLPLLLRLRLRTEILIRIMNPLANAPQRALD